MHPDSILAGLRRELKRAPERAKEIEKEIAHWDHQERPAALPENLVAVADHDRTYLAGLKREFDRVNDSEKDRRKEIQAEIARVEALIRNRSQAADPQPEEDDVNDKPDLSPEEIEQRKALRTDQQVERATNDPSDLARAAAEPSPTEQETT